MDNTRYLAQCPNPLDDADWVREQYVDKRLGSHDIARKVGRAPSTVLCRLRKHGIPIRPCRVSRHAECDGSWLAEHYLDRGDYVDWCRQRGVEPEGDGGHGLPASACAAQAEVSRETIRRWLVQHGIERRGPEDRSSIRRERQHRYSLGPEARAAIRRFEAEDVVQGVEVRQREVLIQYSTGLRERWGLGDGRAHRLHFPDGGWWRRPAQAEGPLVGLLGEDGVPEPYSSDDLLYSADARDLMGFLDLRLLVHGLVRDLVAEGWRRPTFTNLELESDLRHVLADTTVHAPTPGYANGQPGRPRSGVPAGLRLALNLSDWGPLRRPGGISLHDAWRDPRRVYWAIESIVRRGEDIGREAIIHRMSVGAAEGIARKAGPPWLSPKFWICILRDVLGLDHGPIVIDAGRDCGSRAVAVGALAGIYLHNPALSFNFDSPLWEHGAEIEPDDGFQSVDVVFADCDSVRQLEDTIDEYGHRSFAVVSALPWSARDDVLGVRGVRVVRYRPRPYLPDAVLAVWEAS